jgi:hypothetical protein
MIEWSGASNKPLSCPIMRMCRRRLGDTNALTLKGLGGTFVGLASSIVLVGSWGAMRGESRRNLNFIN